MVMMFVVSMLLLDLCSVTASMPSFSWMNISDPPGVRAAKVNFGLQKTLVIFYL